MESLLQKNLYRPSVVDLESKQFFTGIAIEVSGVMTAGIVYPIYTHTLRKSGRIDKFR